jgi:fructose-bisphosphate aldolase class II
LAQNIALTQAVVATARAAGVSVEGELGEVGYANAQASRPTDPAHAKQFAEATGVDALAISIGNVHLQQSKLAQIDYDALAQIEALTSLPLVLHGGSGIGQQDRRRLAHQSSVCKFNIGTELRMCFGQSLRQSLAQQPLEFDRNKLLKATIAPLAKRTVELISTL